METVKRLSELQPADVSVIERVFGQNLPASHDGELVLRVPDASTRESAEDGDFEIPEYFNVLEGMSDEDLAEFEAILEMPVRLARSE